MLAKICYNTKKWQVAIVKLDPWCELICHQVEQRSASLQDWRRIWLKGRKNPDDHLQKDGPSAWSFAKGQPIWMIICKRPAHPDDQLQKASRSQYSFAKGQPIQMIICKRLAPPDDHLQKAGPSGLSFAKGKPIQMIICKRLAHPDDYLQKATRGDRWWRDRRRRKRQRRKRRRRKFVADRMDWVEGSIRGPRRPKNL